MFEDPEKEAENIDMVEKDSKVQQVSVSHSGVRMLKHKKERKMAQKRLKMLSHMKKTKESIKKWQPFNDDNTAGTDPHKTVFVGRLNFKTDEDRLKKEFEIFGHVKTVRIVRHHTTGKSKGYAFIEFQRERETDNAISKGQNRRIDSHRVIVDREFGRTKTEWLPRRLGGGRGEKRRVGREEEEFIAKTKQDFAEQEIQESTPEPVV